MRRSDSTTSGVEMLVPIFQRGARRRTGLAKEDIGFWCSGSSDYLAGRAFSFVQAVDAIGAFPPVMESHVEMDAAWALYEAWLKVLTGEAEIALAYGFGKSSAGDAAPGARPATRPLPAGPAVAGLGEHRGAAGPGSAWTPGHGPRRRWPRWPCAAAPRALDQPGGAGAGESAAADLLAAPYVADPLRAHDCAPVTDGAAVAILAAGDRARELCPRPAWITGFEHRIDSAVARRARPDHRTVGHGRRAGGRR